VLCPVLTSVSIDTDCSSSAARAVTSFSLATTLPSAQAAVHPSPRVWWCARACACVRACVCEREIRRSRTQPGAAQGARTALSSHNTQSSLALAQNTSGKQQPPQQNECVAALLERTKFPIGSSAASRAASCRLIARFRSMSMLAAMPLLGQHTLFGPHHSFKLLFQSFDQTICGPPLFCDPPPFFCFLLTIAYENRANETVGIDSMVKMCTVNCSCTHRSTEPAQLGTQALQLVTDTVCTSKIVDYSLHALLT